MKLNQLNKFSDVNNVEHIRKWIWSHGLKDCVVTEGGIINCSGDVNFSSRNFGGTLPYKFGTVKGDFIADNSSLRSCYNMPSVVSGSLMISFNRSLESLDHLSCKVGEHVTIASTGVTSLHNVHKQVLSVGGFFNASNCTMKSHIFGVVMIRGIRKAMLHTDLDWTNRVRPEEMIERYLINGEDDPLALQERMIDAGFAKYARL